MRNAFTVLGLLVFLSAPALSLARAESVPWSAPAVRGAMAPSNVTDVFLAPIKFLTKAAAEGSFDWKVGDTLNYVMLLKPLPLTGTTKVSVTQDTKEGFWLTEDVLIKSFKQETQVLIDKDTGEIKKMIVNGKPQVPPSGGDENVVKAEEAHITVPAGSFDCIHFVIEDSDQNQTEQWVNPRDLPISGMIKSVADAGILEIDTELTSFVRGK